LSPAAGFVLFLLLTLVFIALAVLTGLRALRRAHVPAVAATCASLAVTIFFAERLGELYDLGAAGVVAPIHLTLAKVTTLAYLLPLATGVATILDARRRKLHRRMALCVIALTVLTAATGLTMILLAERLPA